MGRNSNSIILVLLVYKYNKDGNSVCFPAFTYLVKDKIPFYKIYIVSHRKKKNQWMLREIWMLSEQNYVHCIWQSEAPQKLYWCLQKCRDSTSMIYTLCSSLSEMDICDMRARQWSPEVNLFQSCHNKMVHVIAWACTLPL